METSKRFGFWLPSNTDVADIQQIVENFRVIESEVASLTDIPRGSLFVKKTDVLSQILDANYGEVEKPVNTQAVINYTQRELGNYLTSTELKRVFADGEISASDILYSTDPDDPKTIKEKVDYLEGTVGDIDSVLDELHNYAQALIGGEA